MLNLLLLGLRQAGLAALLTVAAAGAAGAQAAPAAAATIRLEGLVATPRTLTATELAALPHREQATTDKDGKKHVYRGVALHDVLHLAGAPRARPSTAQC
jgi:DMSO/TMAO reductase YedYZ molybdopterin-dependent catalytic subunit